MGNEKNHFILIKQDGFSANQEYLSARESAQRLLDAKMWPLWERTRCQHMVKAGGRILIYLAGSDPECKKVIASASVENVVPWNDKTHRNKYPLLLDGVPTKVLLLKEIHFFPIPIAVKDKLDVLSFIPKNKKKWGVAMMGGMRSLSKQEFDYLSV